MDVVPRQSYVSGIVPAEERTATMGITNIVRSLGAACGPLVVGFLSAGGHFGYQPSSAALTNTSHYKGGGAYGNSGAGQGDVALGAALASIGCVGTILAIFNYTLDTTVG